MSALQQLMMAAVSAGGGGGSVAFVQKKTGNGGSVDSVSITFDTNNTAANAIIVGAFWYSTDVTTPASGNVTDSRNTYTIADSRMNGTAQAAIWYAQNIGAGANTVIFNPPGTNNYIECCVIEYSGLVTSSMLDKTAGNTGNSNTPTSGTTATTAQANEIVIAVLAHNGSSATGIDLPSGYTNRHIQQDNSVYEPGSMDQLVVASTGAQSASWGTTSVSDNWAAVIATFKVA